MQLLLLFYDRLIKWSKLQEEFFLNNIQHIIHDVFHFFPQLLQEDINNLKEWANQKK